MSFRSASASWPSFSAPSGGLKVKSAAVVATSVFQSWMTSVYWGAAPTDLVVMTIFARQRFVAAFNPKLPVGFLITKGEVVALDTADDTVADVFSLDDVADQSVVDIAQEKVGARYGDAAITQCVDELVDRAGCIDLGVAVDVLAEEAERSSVEIHLDVGITPGHGGMDGRGPREH